MSNAIKMIKKHVNILIKFLPLLAFIIPILQLYFLYPKSFEGDPTWEGSWQGRFFYLFFLWLVSLEIILNWEELKTSKLKKIKSFRTAAFIVALLLPTIYMVAANYCGVNVAIQNLARQNNIYFANLISLAVEYLTFAALFNLIILITYGTKSVANFSISAFFLIVIGVLYTIDDVYPFGRFTPFQMIVQTTAGLGANILNLMGYQTSISVINDPYYGYLPSVTAWDPANSARNATFGIAWPCAGVESLLIYTVTVLLFLRKANIKWQYKVLYFAIGAVVTYFINALRVASIFVVAINGGDWLRFHNIYGPLYSIVWIVAYILIIIGSQALWGKIRQWRMNPKDISSQSEKRN